VARDWETTLRKWGEPASATEEEKRDRTVRAVTDALNAVPDIKDLPITVYPKGSYANNTNVRDDSDVDVSVEYTGIEYFDLTEDLEGLTRDDIGFSEVTEPYSPEKLKGDVERALVKAFGRDAVKRNNKAITVREQSTRLAADVVPCFTYRRYYGRDSYGQLKHHKGVKLFPDKGWPIINWPTQHYDNGVTKNKATGLRYKRMVRGLKYLENELCEKRLIKAAPGYFAECLVYNVPSDNFNQATYTADMRSVLAYIFNETLPSGDSSEFVEVNYMKWLFPAGAKWTSADAHTLADAAWDYMGLE
jgi:hypothetical protein